jgi:hypothetical protein
MTSLPAFVDWVFAQQVDPAEQRNAAGESARDTSPHARWLEVECGQNDTPIGPLALSQKSK